MITEIQVVAKCDNCKGEVGPEPLPFFIKEGWTYEAYYSGVRALEKGVGSPQLTQRCFCAGCSFEQQRK